MDTVGRVLSLLLVLLPGSFLSSQSVGDPKAGNAADGSSSIQEVLTRAQAAELERHYAEAIKLLRDALKQYPADAGLQLELGRAYLATGQDGKAERLFREILKKQPDHREAQLEFARSLAFQQHYEESDRLYRQLLAQNPGDEGAAIGLTSNLLHEGRTAEATAVASAALPYHPNSLRLLEYRDRIASGLLGGDERALTTPGNVFTSDTEFITDSAGNHAWVGTQRLQVKIRPGITSDLRIEEQFLHGIGYPLDVVQTTSETIRWRPWERLAVSVGGGAVRFDNGDVSPIYETTITTQLASRFVVGAGFSRVPILPDAKAAEYRITAQGWDAFGLWAPEGWQVNFQASQRHYTDDNEGALQMGEILRQWTTPRLNYIVGYRFRHYGFDENTAHGYFSPDNYQSHQAKLGLVFHPNRRYRGELSAFAGGESIASGAPFQAAWEITTRNQLTLGHWELGLDYSRYHMAQITGAFRADAARFELAYHF